MAHQNKKSRITAAEAKEIIDPPKWWSVHVDEDDHGDQFIACDRSDGWEIQMNVHSRSERAASAFAPGDDRSVGHFHSIGGAIAWVDMHHPLGSGAGRKSS